MSLFNVLNIAGSALDAQSKRLNVVASNLAMQSPQPALPVSPIVHAMSCFKPFQSAAIN